MRYIMAIQQQLFFRKAVTQYVSLDCIIYSPVKHILYKSEDCKQRTYSHRPRLLVPVWRIAY